MAESRIHGLASFLGLELDDGFRVDGVEPGRPAEVRLTRGEETILVRLLPASSEEKAYRKTRRFAVGYRKLPGTTVPLGPIDALVKWLAASEASMPDAVLEALWPAAPSSPAASGRDGPRKLQLLEHVEAPKRQGERPVRVVLVNLCEDPCEYGPGASEYLRAKLLSIPVLADRLEVTVLFMSGLDTDAFAERIAAHEPDLVAFTCYSWNLDSSARTTRRLRALGGERGGQPVVVWGGCSFAMLYERRDWFTYWDDVDAVAIGSGEQTIVDLATRVLALGPGQGLGDAPIRGTILNVGGRLVEGERARVPATLEEVPSPYQSASRSAWLAHSWKWRAGAGSSVPSAATRGAHAKACGYRGRKRASRPTSPRSPRGQSLGRSTQVRARPTCPRRTSQTCARGSDLATRPESSRTRCRCTRRSFDRRSAARSRACA